MPKFQPLIAPNGLEFTPRFKTIGALGGLLGILISLMIPCVFIYGLFRLGSACVYALEHSDQRRLYITYTNPPDPSPVNRPMPVPALSLPSERNAPTGAFHPQTTTRETRVDRPPSNSAVPRSVDPDLGSIDPGVIDPDSAIGLVGAKVSTP